MQIVKNTAAIWFIVLSLGLLCLIASDARAQSSYFTSQGCTACHAPPVVATCNGCHGHGVHSSSAKSSVNLAGTTNKSSYAPGETVTVTISGGYRTGWVRAVLYDQNGVELARSAGNASGVGSSTTFPAVLSAPAPVTAGSYSWRVGWYGNESDAAGAAFGSGWVVDAGNPGHGAEIVNISAPFTVTAATPQAPLISSVAPNTLVQGAVNQTVTIAGSNLSGSAVSFSNPGVAGGTATVGATSISLPVSVSATAPVGVGTINVATATGSTSSPFSVTAAATQAPTIAAIAPASLVQGTVGRIVLITGTNLAGATIRFSNTGISAGAATISATSISVPVSVATQAALGAGTVSVTTAGGSASVPFIITSMSVPAPAITSVVPDILPQGAVNQTVTIAGANLANATVSFSNTGVFAGAPTVTATSILLPVTVAANAASGAGTILVSTAGGSVAIPFSVSPRANGPTLVVSALSDGSFTNNGTLNISGTVRSGLGVQSVTVNSQNVAILPDGSFSTALTLMAGANTITVVATDRAGVQQIDTRTIRFDPVAPVLTLTVPADNSTSTASFVNVNGTISETSTVTVTDNAGNLQSASINGNTFSATIILAAGVNTIRIVATDLAGNTSSAKRTVTYDTSKLTLSVTHPAQDLTTDFQSIAVRGTVTNSSKEILVTITVAGKSYIKRVTNGIFMQRVEFKEAGLYAITVFAKDAAGNSSTVTRNVIYSPNKVEDVEEDDQGGVISHPFGWSDPKSSHEDYVERSGVAECVVCHSIDESSKGQAMSCFNCHGREW